MPAPLGNQYALGSTNNGRPGRDLIQLGNDLIAWAQKPTSTNLCQFCRDHLLSDGRFFEYVEKDEVFRECYRTAKMIIGARREEMINDPDGPRIFPLNYSRQLHVYDAFAKAEAREEIAYKASVDAENNTEDMKNALVKANEITNQLSELRVRMINDKSDNTTPKSA